jgi:hypothetical protein
LGSSPNRPRHGVSCVLAGARKVDPYLDDLFKVLIEQRKVNESDETLKHALKVIAKAIAYGASVELNEQRESKPVKLDVFSGEHYHNQPTRDVEVPGKWLLSATRKFDYVWWSPASRYGRKMRHRCGRPARAPTGPRALPTFTLGALWTKVGYNPAAYGGTANFTVAIFEHQSRSGHIVITSSQRRVV